MQRPNRLFQKDPRSAGHVWRSARIVGISHIEARRTTTSRTSRALSRAKPIVAAAVDCLVAAPAAFAATSSFGPQSWSSGTETGRYRSQAGTHNIKPYNGCGSASVTIELRVDVIDASDYSEGTKTIQCGTTKAFTGMYNSYQSAFRGHFMKSHSSWYGTLQDTHP